jgi:hypothetical protein
MGLAPAIHGALCKDKIKERNDLNQYLTNLPEHAPREIRDLITDLDQIRN